VHVTAVNNVHVFCGLCIVSTQQCFHLLVKQFKNLSIEDYRCVWESNLSIIPCAQPEREPDKQSLVCALSTLHAALVAVPSYTSRLSFTVSGARFSGIREHRAIVGDDAHSDFVC
jgi:hypothetical protein